MKYLCVAEKNDAAKTIAGLLSNGTANRRDGYSVYNKIYEFEANVKGRQSKMVMTSVSGHLLHLEFLSSYRNWRSIDPQALFDAPVRKACSEDFEPIKRTLEREIRGCQGLIVWTDCDREGENIGFEIVEVCRRVKPNISVHRAIFSEITATAVRRALAQLKTPDQRQSDAVDVRTELDLRTGAAITRFQTMRLQRLFPAKIADKLISYGSCQIPTLGFVVERYKEVEAFVSEPFWKIKVIHTIEDLTVEFSWARNRLFDKQACEDFLLICLADPKAKVEVVTVKPKNKWRPVAMDTVELEKLGSRKLKLSAKETMTIAEKLYTKGIISYPRTETNQFSKDIDLRSLVEQQTGHSIWGSFAERVREWGPNPRNGNKSDQAHPPIHPTKLVTNLTGNEGRVYELIVRHFLACVSKDAVGSETIVHINIAGEKFTATGLVIYERNYLDVYIYEKWNAKQIHHYEEGQIFDPTDITMVEGATTAPPLLTEADLIALMEKHGIGTDATHAEHINTIKERGYIGVVDNGSLVPGVIGMGLYEGYDAMQLALAKPVLRAAFEEDLKKICQGTKDPKAVLAEQIQKYKEAYRQIMANITAMDEKMGLRISETPTARTNDDSNAAANLENNPNLIQELFQCPKCNSAPLALKPKRNQGGHFIGCLNYPDCKNVVWFPEECKEPKVIDEFCQHCGGVAKLLKFKFQTAFHKTMFNAPYGWYKTCLRCDGKFRETFNINVETVKRVGAIVGDRMTARSVAPTAVAAEANSNLRNRNNAQTSNNGPLGSNPTSRPSDDGSGLRNKKPKKTSTSTTAQPARNGNIRSFFTAASTRQEDGTQNTTNQHAPLEELFDSNDGFEEALQAVEASNLVSNTNATPQQSRSSALAADVVLDADLAAVFADDSLGDFNWDTSESSNNRTEQSRTIQTTHSTNFSWGTAGNANPAPSRPPTNCSNDNWGSGARRGPNPSAINPYSRRESGNGTPSTSHNPRHVNRPSGTSNENVDDDFSWGTGAGFRGAADAVIQDPDVSFGTLVGSRAENFDDYTWGSAANRSRNDNDSSSNGPTNKRPRLQTPQSSLDRPTWSNITPQQHDVKCTGCHQLAKELTVRKDGPNKGRQFYACPKSNACKFFQWADEEPQANTSMQSSSSSGRQSQGSAAGGWGTGASVRTAPSSQGASAGGWGTTANIRTASNSSNSPTLSGGWGTGPNAGANEDPANSDSIKCSCGKAASSLTVRKDGPNKGRPFYACPNRDKSCGFFKWGDEDDNQASTSAAAQQRWGTAAARNYTPGGGSGSSSTDQQREPKKRKCGLCRQEGHTKLKCPRKAEFDV